VGCAECGAESVIFENSCSVWRGSDLVSFRYPFSFWSHGVNQAGYLSLKDTLNIFIDDDDDDDDDDVNVNVNVNSRFV